MNEIPLRTICNARYLRAGLFDPLVEIQDPSDPSKWYVADMEESTNNHFRRDANRIRGNIIKMGNRSGRFSAMVVRSYGNEGDYCVVGTRLKPRIEELNFPAEEAFEVLRGETIFYAKILFHSDEKDDFGVRAWKDFGHGKKLFGFLKPASMDDHTFHCPDYNYRRLAEEIITEEILKGSDRDEKIKPGDCVIVRTVAESPYKKITFFEPVVNIMEDDEAEDEDGQELETIVTGYRKNDLIYDLPIIQTRNNRGSKDRVGLGYIERPSEEMVRFFYKPVKVLDAGDDKHKIVRQARIISNGKQIVLAQKVE